jgi:uncharacterized RDD family membrane protein YckC
MKYAGFWVRSVAHLIDFVFLNGIELAVEYGISTPLHVSAFTQQVIGVILTLGLSYWYYVSRQVRTGTTYGKKLFDIYVISERTGEFMSRKQAIIRLCGYIASYLMIGCGFLMAAFHPQKKAFHDLLAGTVSVRRPKEVIKTKD